MDKIIKALIFDKKARITLIDSTETVNKAINIHNLSPLGAAALGRALTAGAYIGTNLKGKNSTFSLIIKGGGPIGNIVVAGESGNTIRGFVSNPIVEMPLKKNGKLDVGQAVGKNGYIQVIKDYGLKKPYNGNCQLMNGEIAEDFAAYLLRSEGIKSAVSLGVRVGSEGAISAGGIIVEALPGIDESQLVMLEDIMSNFKEISAVLCQKSIEEVFQFYFNHLDCKVLAQENLQFKCNCSRTRIERLIKGLGKEEAFDIIEKVGKLEIACQFCNKKYAYNREEASRFWEM